MQVVLLLALIWAAVLVPPAVRAHARRRAEFVGSFERRLEALGRSAAGSTAPARRTRAPIVTRAQRRRQSLRCLLVAMGVTLVGGLLPAFRVLLVVHLFLVDSFIAYIALLAYWAQRAPAPARRAPAGPARQWWSREPKRGPEVLPGLAPLG